MGRYDRSKVKISIIAVAIITSLISCVSCGNKSKTSETQPEVNIPTQNNHLDNFVKLKYGQDDYEDSTDNNSGDNTGEDGASDRDTLESIISESDNVKDTEWQDENIEDSNIISGVDEEGKVESDGSIVHIDSSGNVINKGDSVIDSDVVGKVEPKIDSIAGYYDFINTGKIDYELSEFGVDVGLFIQNLGNKKRYITDALAYICKQYDLKISDLRYNQYIKTTDDFEYQLLTFYNGSTQITIAINDDNRVKYTVKGGN